MTSVYDTVPLNKIGNCLSVSVDGHSSLKLSLHGSTQTNTMICDLSQATGV